MDQNFLGGMTSPEDCEKYTQKQRSQMTQRIEEVCESAKADEDEEDVKAQKNESSSEDQQK